MTGRARPREPRAPRRPPVAAREQTCAGPVPPPAGGEVPGEEGSGTMAVIGVLVVAAVLAGALALAGAVQAHAVRTSAVADLAALAAGDVSATAQWSPVGDQPCDLAGQVAAANGMDLAECEVVGPDTRVVVSRGLDLGALTVTVSARARAGPEDG
nr:Rv3654c family TadE-like protein [Actinomyces sp.]